MLELDDVIQMVGEAMGRDRYRRRLDGAADTRSKLGPSDVIAAIFPDCNQELVKLHLDRISQKELNKQLERLDRLRNEAAEMSNQP